MYNLFTIPFHTFLCSFIKNIIRVLKIIFRTINMLFNIGYYYYYPLIIEMTIRRNI